MIEKINSFATSCYRIMLGIKRLDKVTNVAVLERVEQQPLSIAVQQRQLRWLGHALRRGPMEPATIFALYEPAPRHGKTLAGRPPEPYREYVSKLLMVGKDMSADQIVTAAQNRKWWAERVTDIGMKN